MRTANCGGAGGGFPAPPHPVVIAAAENRLDKRRLWICRERRREVRRGSEREGEGRRTRKRVRVRGLVGRELDGGRERTLSEF